MKKITIKTVATIAVLASVFCSVFIIQKHKAHAAENKIKCGFDKVITIEEMKLEMVKKVTQGWRRLEEWNGFIYDVDSSLQPAKWGGPLVMQWPEFIRLFNNEQEKIVYFTFEPLSELELETNWLPVKVMLSKYGPKPNSLIYIYKGTDISDSDNSYLVITFVTSRVEHFASSPQEELIDTVRSSNQLFIPSKGGFHYLNNFGSYTIYIDKNYFVKYDHFGRVSD